MADKQAQENQRRASGSDASKGDEARGKGSVDRQPQKAQKGGMPGGKKRDGSEEE